MSVQLQQYNLKLEMMPRIGITVTKVKYKNLSIWNKFLYFFSKDSNNIVDVPKKYFMDVIINDKIGLLKPNEITEKTTAYWHDQKHDSYVYYILYNLKPYGIMEDNLKLCEVSKFEIDLMKY